MNHDFAHCYGEDNGVICPHRESCIRHKSLTYPSLPMQYTLIMVDGADMNDCKHYVPLNQDRY